MRVLKTLKDCYIAAMNQWGVEAQLGMLQEECGELITAINQFERRRDNSFLHLAEELADVEILIGQIKIALYNHGGDKDTYINQKRRKIRRFKKRLENKSLNWGVDD